MSSVKIFDNDLKGLKNRMNWTSPEEANLTRLKNIKKELEELIKNIEENEIKEGNLQNEDEQVCGINNELLSKSNLRHKTRTTRKINVDNVSMSDTLKH